MVFDEVKKFFLGSKDGCSCESTCDDSCRSAPKKKGKKSGKRK